MTNSDKVSNLRTDSLLTRLDYGAYREAIASADLVDEASGETQDLLLRAEVALYLDRVGDAEACIDRLGTAELWIDEIGDAGAFARRARLIRIEIAYLKGETEEASRLIRPLVEAARRTNDEQSALRAMYDLARTARSHGEWALAAERSEQTLELAVKAKNEFYVGRASYVLGVAWYQQNQFRIAAEYLETARRNLTATEDLRFRATVESFLGNLRSDRGELDEAIALLESAETTAAGLGIMTDMLIARTNMARAHLNLGMYEEAERELGDMLLWLKEFESTPTELIALRLLAISACVRGALGAASESASEALRLAELRGNATDRLEARLLVARARSLAREPEAREELSSLVREVDASGTPYHRAEARIYLARALVSENPAAAKSLCDEVRAMPVVGDYFWLARELGFVEADLNRLPVSLSPDGRLVMDSTLGWPDLRMAREAVERYWLERALVETEGNVSAAGRLLGLTRNESHYLHHLVVKGQLARPSRSQKSDQSETPSRRRPKSRR